MDININLKDYKLNVRTCAFIRCGEEVLLCEHKTKDYYSLPGGHVKVGESSKDALKRELKEELNYDIHNDELILTRIVENFFIKENNEKVHEYLFIYRYDLDKNLYNGDFKNLENENITMNWVRKEAFILLNVAPGICKGIIANPEFQHIISNKI